MNTTNLSTIENLLNYCKQIFANKKLSLTSRKLYIADIKRFLTTLESHGEIVSVRTLVNPKTYAQYLGYLKAQSLSPSVLSRSLASLRQLGAVVSELYAVDNPVAAQSHTQSAASSTVPLVADNYIKYYINHLKAETFSQQTIKSYKSDIEQYCRWADDNLSSTHIETLLDKKNSEKYTNYLTNVGKITESTIDRKSASLSRFREWYYRSYPARTQTDNKSMRNEGRSAEITPEVEKNEDLPHSDSVKTLKNKWTWMVPSWATIISLGLFVTLIGGLGFFGYRQLMHDRVLLTQAYPSTPVTPNRQLSFQGRLESSAGTPITAATNFVFKLFDNTSGGTQLYTSGTCSITPDSDGVFSTQIGSTCGSAIAATVFTENANVYLEVTVGAETLTPRQQIATVAYALNSETLQGFPISATVSAVRNTVVPMNQWGEIIVGEQSPRLTGVSGTFQISAPALSLITAAGTNGNITIAPNGTGQVNVNGGTTTTNFFNVSNANLTTGSLITGTVANNNSGFKLLDLQSGSSPTSKFSVNNAGDVTMAGDLTISGGNITSATTFDSTVTATGIMTANNSLVANGNVQLGNAITDTIDFQGRVAQDSDLIPIGTTGTNDLGSSALPWDNAYLGNTLTTNLQDADGSNFFDGGCTSSQTVSGIDQTGAITCTSVTAGSLKWNGLTDPDGALTLAHGTNATTFGWTPTGALNAFTFNLTNAGASSTTQNGIVINNALTNSASTDVLTDNLLLVQQLDTSTGDSKVVDDGIMVDVAGNAGMNNGVNITNSAGNLGTGIKIADTAGGTLTTGISLSGTMTTGIDAGNTIIANIGNAGTDFDSSGGLTLAGNLVANGNTQLGNAITDTIDFQGRVAQDADLIPIGTTGTNDLGSSSLPWDNVYANSVSFPGAGSFALADNTAGAFQLKEGANVYMDVTTTDNAESLSLNLPVGGATSHTANLFTSNIAQTINIGTGTAIDTINIGTGGTNADVIKIGGLSTSHTDFTGAVNFAAGTTYFVDSSGNAKFLDLQAVDTGNPGLTVGNGTIGFAKIGGSTISDNSGDLTLDSDSNSLTISSSDTSLVGTGLATIDTADTLNLAATTITLNSNSTINGGSAANDDISIQGTSNATRTSSYVLLQPNGGNVGIGTSTPSWKLEVNTGADSNGVPDIEAGALLPSYLMSDYPTLGLNMYWNATANSWQYGKGSVSKYGGAIDVNPGTGNMDFYVTSTAGNAGGNVTPLDAMVIDKNGNVGIGTQSPGANLDVAGSARLLKVSGTNGYGLSFWDGTNKLLNYQAYDSGTVTFSLLGTNRTFTGTAWSSTGYVATRKGASLQIENDELALYQFAASSTTPTEVLRVKSGGNVGIGTSSPAAKLSVSDESNAGIAFNEYNASDGVNIRTYRARGTIASPSQVLSGDRLTALTGFGYTNSSAYSAAAANISLVAAENYTSTANGSYITFSTTPTGSTTSSERMRIDATGNVGIGKSAQSGFILDANGEIVSSTTGSGGGNIRMIGGNYGAFYRNDGSNLYLLLTASTDQYGGWNSLRPFTVNFASGDVTLGQNVTVSGTLYTTAELEARGGIADDGGDLILNDNVAIGGITNSSGHRLWVNTATASTYAAVFENSANSTTANGVAIRAGQFTAGTGTLIDFYDGDGTFQGQITYNAGTVSYAAFTANHNTAIPDADNAAGYPYGTLLCLDDAKSGTDAASLRDIEYRSHPCNSGSYAPNILGVYAGKNTSHGEVNSHQVYVLGDGHILVNGESGDIAVGDKLTTSSTSGIGMKATDVGSTFGIAQQSIHFSSASDTKLIAVQYGLGYNIPSLSLNESGSAVIAGDEISGYTAQTDKGTVTKHGAFANLVSAVISAGSVVTKHLASDSFTIGGQTLRDYIVSTVQSMSLQENGTGQVISPLADGSSLTLDAPVKIQRSEPCNVGTCSATPALTVDGEIQSSSISARVAELQEVHADKIVAGEIVADKISANSIDGLDARIASLSTGTTSDLSAADIQTITDRIRSRIDAMNGNTATAADLPTESDATGSAMLTQSIDTISTSTSSANLASADIDFATINTYLAVVGHATITDLTVTNTLNVTTIQAPCSDSSELSGSSELCGSVLALQPLGGTVKLANDVLIVNASGEVAINGNLTVTGTVLAQNGSFGTLSVGNSQESTHSALGNLLAVYDEQGKAVATIDASGSANLARVTTQIVAIAAASTATPSADLATSLTAEDATAGEAILKRGGTDLTITNTFVTHNSLVYLTPTTNTDNKVLFVKAKNACDSDNTTASSSDTKCVPSFTVGIDTPAGSDITFNWWIIELKK